jgi:arabinan endo-1,5-alpha-L-arabinosidase
LTNITLDPDSPDYKWEDRGMVVASKEGSNNNAIDPSPIIDPSGRLWLSYGSFFGGIALVELNPKTGLRISPQSSIYYIAKIQGEASYISYHKGFYYLFANLGACCKGVDSTYRIIMARSASITGPYLDKEGRDISNGGGSVFLESWRNEIGPGQIGIFSEGKSDSFTYHYYDAHNNGSPTLGRREIQWGADGWPAAGDRIL